MLKKYYISLFIPDLPDSTRILYQAFRNSFRLCLFLFTPIPLPAPLSVPLLVGPLVPFQIVSAGWIIAHRTLSTKLRLYSRKWPTFRVREKNSPNSLAILLLPLLFFLLSLDSLLLPRFELGQTSTTDLHLWQRGRSSLQTIVHASPPLSLLY